MCAWVLQKKSFKNMVECNKKTDSCKLRFERVFHPLYYFSFFLLFLCNLHSHIQNMEIPVWMHEQIKADLAPFSQNQMKKEILDATMAQEETNGSVRFLVRYQIVDNQ